MPTNIFCGNETRCPVRQYGCMDPACLAIERLMLIQHFEQDRNLFWAEYQAIFSPSKPKTRARLHRSHPASAAGCTSPLFGFLGGVVEPDIHIVAMLADAYISNFVEILDDVFVEAEFDRIVKVIESHYNGLPRELKTQIK